MKTGVLFDLDATLCDSENQAHKLAMDAMYDSYSAEFPMDRQKFDELFKHSRAEIKREHKGMAVSHERLFYIQRMIEKTHQTIVPDLILKHYHAYWDTLVANVRLLPNTLDTLKELKARGIKTAIVSNLTAYVQFRKLIKLEITPFIDYLVTSQEAGVEKPHPGIFLAALNKMGMLPKDVIMVGDSLDTDIEGANAAGIDSIWLYTERPEVEKLLKEIRPKYTVKNISEILNYIN